MLVAVLAGLVSGVVIAILTVLAEHSRIGINSYALYGNGALIVPAILAPFALYPGWTWIIGRGGRALEMVMFVVGLHFGVGATSLLEVLFYPSGPDVTLADAIPGFLLTGAIFVLPASLLAGLGYWIVMGARGPALAVVLVAGLVIAAVLAAFWGVGLGFLAGGAVAFAQRGTMRRVAAGIALFLAMIVIANLPLIGALTTPSS